jgi:hypothetical protein
VSNDWNAQFLRFHATNPDVYRRLVEMAYQWRARRPRERVGIGLLVAVLRWEEVVDTTGDHYRINEDYAPHYARLIMAREPDLAGLFETRPSVADVPTHDPAQATLWSDAAAGDGWLEQAMRTLDENDL